MPLGSSSATPVINPGPTRARGCSFSRAQTLVGAGVWAASAVDGAGEDININDQP
jgi:hypothetical protein